MSTAIDSSHYYFKIEECETLYQHSELIKNEMFEKSYKFSRFKKLLYEICYDLIKGKGFPSPDGYMLVKLYSHKNDELLGACIFEKSKPQLINMQHSVPFSKRQYTMDTQFLEVGFAGFYVKENSRGAGLAKLLAQKLNDTLMEKHCEPKHPLLISAMDKGYSLVKRYCKDLYSTRFVTPCMGKNADISDCSAIFYNASVNDYQFCTHNPSKKWNQNHAKPSLKIVQQLPKKPQIVTIKKPNKVAFC